MAVRPPMTGKRLNHIGELRLGFAAGRFLNSRERAVGAHADASVIQRSSRRIEVGAGLFSVVMAVSENSDRKHSECSSTQLNSRVALMCSLIIYGQGGLHFQLPTDSTLVRHWPRLRFWT
jgi:hypothetical protein